jgi:hypothetical protein
MQDKSLRKYKKVIQKQLFLQAMKFFAIILSFTIFYLVSIPCVDEIIHSNKSAIEHTSPQENPCNHSDHDACSPFCVCSCCGVVVVMSFIYFDSIPYLILQAIINPIQKSLYSSFYQSFWQPPKLF